MFDEEDFEQKKEALVEELNKKFRACTSIEMSKNA